MEIGVGLDQGLGLTWTQHRELAQQFLLLVVQTGRCDDVKVDDDLPAPVGPQVRDTEIRERHGLPGLAPRPYVDGARTVESFQGHRCPECRGRHRQ